MSRVLLLTCVASCLVACAPPDGRPLEAADMATSAPPPADTGERRLQVKLTLTGGKLTIRTTDGSTPVMTDVWLYTMEGAGIRPFGAFVDPDSKRKSRRRMLPCALSGMPSALVPCDEGEDNGVMTDAVREQIVDGEVRSAIDGTVELTLSAAPASPLLVLAAIEDQRHYGAAAVAPDGKSVSVPEGLSGRRPVKPRSYDKDVRPLLQAHCVGCHSAGGPAEVFRLASYEDIVTRNFAFAEEQAKCEAMFPMDEMKRRECIKAITAVEYMIEPGAPALSPLLRRTRPDEMKSLSPEGLRWYGSGGKRFGSAGDRRMPPSNITPTPADDVPLPSYFDNNPADYQILFDWVAQGAPR